ncbi:hypothetical protein ACOSQ3_021466 [Xanthoceras sorbifolium]
MSSLSDQKRHEPNVGGSFAPEKHDPRLFDEVVIEYERFMSKQLAIDRSQKEFATKVSSSGGHDEGVGVISGEDEVDNSSQTTFRRQQPQVKSFSSLPSIITRKDIVGFAIAFHLPRGHKVMVSKVTDRPARPPPGYVAISPHHLHDRLRFPLSKFLIRVLNL